jgi:hypothetical protein
MRTHLVLLFASLSPSLPLLAQTETRPHTAAELIAGVRAAKPEDSFYARLRIEHSEGGGKPVTLQVQLKRRPTSDGSDSLYQVLFPKDRKGEGLLLKLRKNSISGASMSAEGKLQPVGAGSDGIRVFGTALTVEDLQAEFLKWPQQTIVGQEKVGALPCTIVESRPSSSSSQRVRSWIDESRYATMHVEFYNGSDKPHKVVETRKVLRGSNGFFAPVSFTITDVKSGASTEVEGVKSDPATYTDADFSDAALKTLTTAPGSNG